MRLYTPVVKAKKNDLAAIDLLTDQAKSSMKPLIEAPITLSENHLETRVAEAAALLSNRLADVPYFFDPLGIENFSRQVQAFQLLGDAGARFTPVVGLGRGAIDHEALAKVVGTHDLGLAIRLEISDLEDASEDTWAQIITLVAATGTSPPHLTILIDFGQLANRDISVLVNVVIDFLALQPKYYASSRVSVLGGSALRSVASVAVDGSMSVERRELDLWGTLQFELSGSRELGFGDYGIIDPSFIFAGGAIPQANAKIRYTHGGSTVYFRGHGLYKPNRFPQYHDLARRVLQSPFFLGANFSFGDGVIERCANFDCGPGNLGTWVKADTNHHLEFTARQISRMALKLADLAKHSELKDLIAET